MNPGEAHCHVVSFWVEDDSPRIDWWTTRCEGSDNDPFEYAAFFIKEMKHTPVGFCIIKRWGLNNFEVLEKYVPSGGPMRFSFEQDGDIFTLKFDGHVIG